ncbi:MAG TPA: ATP-binding cassette domain-containing protein [Solirubrobacteraceae bacterium]|nr:ATP-binding cassette domain-containing protein [Solirubrobacteraceae bacterium]
MSSEPVAELSGAAVRLGERTIWRNLDFTLSAGELVVVLGPNGAGKSTLLQVMLGLQPLCAGSARVLGSSLRAPERGRAHSARNLRALRQRIGYLPQRRAFDRSARVRGVDLIALGIDGRRPGLPLPALSFMRAGPFARAHERRAQVQQLVAAVEAGEFAERPIGECSGGEQQRLLIAQALAHDPALLLLDEPLNGLDLSSQAAVSALVGRLCKERSLATLLVAHDVNPLLPHLDRVLYLAGGQGAIGPPEQIITGARLSELYGAPIDVLRTTDGRLVVLGGPEAPAHHPELLR